MSHRQLDIAVTWSVIAAHESNMALAVKEILDDKVPRLQWN